MVPDTLYGLNIIGGKFKQGAQKSFSHELNLARLMTSILIVAKLKEFCFGGESCSKLL
jgi:hypothetical protein